MSTQKVYGDAFVEICKKAGLWGLPFMVSDEEVLFSESMPQKEREQIERLMVRFSEDPDALPPDGTPPVPVVVNALDFYRRLTPEEGTKVEKAMSGQPFIQRRIFETATTFRSDAPNGEWALLYGLAVSLFGEERAGVLLAPSEG